MQNNFTFSLWRYKKTRIFLSILCLSLLVVSCGSASDTEEVLALRQKVETLEAQLAGENAVWDSGYQDLWMKICEEIFVNEEENNPKFSAAKVCRCSLDGLMKVFTLKEYEPWPQNIKDAAAAPHLHWCWPS